MSQVWGMINGLQIIINLPLFNVAFPELSQSMVENMIAIATFDVMPSDEVFLATLDAPESEQEDQKFQDVGYGSNFMILNLGTMFLTLVIMLTVPCCILVTLPCKSSSKCLTNKHKGCTDALRGNFFIRFLLEGCLDISICATLNILKGVEDDGLDWSDKFFIVNNVSLIVLSLAIVAFPVWVLIFYCTRFDQWMDEKFEHRYGAIFEGLHADQRSSLAYPFIFVIRRFALVIIAVVTKEILWIQLTTMLLFSIL